ncbi:MAG: DUF4292 domain-containing protein [Fermentimonas sp.]|nr:DUF4292 domain-containing protein [Fermentimonas sp.]
MKRFKNKNILIVCVIVGLAIASCKPRQRIVYSTKPVEDKENNQLFSDINTNSFDFNTFSSRLNMSLSSGTRSLSSKANIRMIRDSAIQISVQPLFGVEVLRFYIDPDSVVILDRMNKRYVEESLNSLKEKYPVGFDFYTMQSILTNSPFVSGKSRVEDSDYRKFNITQTSDLNYYLTSKDPESDIEYSFTVNGDDRITFTHLMQYEKQQSLQWTYDNFAVLGTNSFPHKMNATISSKSRKIDAEFLFSEIVTNQPVQVTSEVPGSYRKATIDEILKIISTE